jgi:trehalose synthase
LNEVPIDPTSTECFREVLAAEDCERLGDALDRIHRVTQDAEVWHVNSTANGGGVAELLAGLLPYASGAAINVHWLVIDASDGFFEITKRLHHRLHDLAGDGGPLGVNEQRDYHRALEPEARQLVERVRPGDLMVLHDPQTAGLAPALHQIGARVVWRCHIGADVPGAFAREAWDFLSDDVRAADIAVFSRPAYAWDVLEPNRVRIMPPCIDVLSPKNRPISDADRDAILQAIGIVEAGGTTTSSAQFRRRDGSVGRISDRVRIQTIAPVPRDAPMIVQVSRWDPLKDPIGLLTAFVERAPAVSDDAHLILAGPDADAVQDDPEGIRVFEEVREAWDRLPSPARARVHLVSLPMNDVDENAAMVNALQGKATIVVQKSLAEGFGLTVAEAMWKHRPVLGGRVGGIQDQIVHGESGILVDDPTDLGSVGDAISSLLADPSGAARLGDAAHRRVCDCYLPVHHFENEADIFEQALA